MEKSNEKQNFNILVIPCDKSFVIVEDKKEEFLNIKPNFQIRKMNAEKLRLFKDKVLQEKNPIHQSFEALAVPCDSTFVISADKRDEFLSQKPNLEIRQRNEEKVNLFVENNLEINTRVKKIGQKKIKLK